MTQLEAILAQVRGNAPFVMLARSQQARLLVPSARPGMFAVSFVC